MAADETIGKGDAKDDKEQPSLRDRRPVNSSERRFAVRVVILLAMVGVAALMVKLMGLFLLIFAAIVFAVLLDAMAALITRATKLGRSWALAAAILFLLSGLVGIFWMFGAQLTREFDTIRQRVPEALAGIERRLDEWGVGGKIRELIESGAGDLSSFVSSAGGYALSAGSGIADFALVLVGAIFLAAQPGLYRRGLLLMVPERVTEITRTALDDSSAALRGWMVGQLLSMAAISVLTGIGLYILGVPAAGGLALLAGLLDIIPFIGPIIASIPAIILAFTVSPATALWTIGLYLLVQQIQGNLLQPLIQKQAVDVPPAVLLFAVVCAGILFGLQGLLLAAPLTVVSYVLVQRIYVQTILKKPIKVAGGKALLLWHSAEDDSDRIP